MKPYVLHLGTLELAVLDSTRAPVTTADLASLARLELKSAWLLTHRPAWYVPFNGQPPLAPVGKTHGVSAYFAGHFHSFYWAEFRDHRPPEIVSGNGGTALEAPLSLKKGAEVDGTKLSNFQSLGGWGFLLLERDGTGWKAEEHDLDGKVVFSFQLR
jgi:hypothetical protein